MAIPLKLGPRNLHQYCNRASHNLHLPPWVVYKHPDHLGVLESRYIPAESTMDIIRRAYRRVPSAIGASSPLPTADEKRGGRRNQLHARLAFLRRPLRLRGNSSISVPLGVVVLFPCIVLILILVLFVRHPSSPGRILIPAGSPPDIRYA